MESTESTRRDFLRHAGLGAAGMLALQDGRGVSEIGDARLRRTPADGGPVVL